MSTDSFLPKGSIILCKSGHEVAETNRDLHKGDIGYSTAVDHWRGGQHIAKKGDKLPLLCKCGAPYFTNLRFPWTKPPEINERQVF